VVTRRSPAARDDAARRRRRVTQSCQLVLRKRGSAVARALRVR